MRITVLIGVASWASLTRAQYVTCKWGPDMHKAAASAVPDKCGPNPVDVTPTWCRQMINAIKTNTKIGWSATNTNPNQPGNFCNGLQDKLNYRYLKCCKSCSEMSE
jgi:hypothetical protein